MRIDKRSRQDLRSDARLEFIDAFYPAQVELSEGIDGVVARFSPLRYRDFNILLSPVVDGVIRKFPIIIRSDGTPWDLGNLYLMHRFTEMAKVEVPSVETIKDIARQLMMYLRWIEHEQAEGRSIHELYFPDDEDQRVTWRYYRYLRRLLRSTDVRSISVSLAKKRMQAVVRFYKGIIAGGLVRDSAIQNRPYNGTVMGIPIVSSVGLQFIKLVEVSNFRFRLPKRERQLGYIQDGGQLRPLTEAEQILVLNQLEQYGNRAFQLICLVSLYTGARIQTVCTLRVKDIYRLLKAVPVGGEVLLLVGEGTGVDTKKQHNYRLHWPVELVKLLRDYIESQEHVERRLESFYGDSDQNYVFLEANGSPFYTSLAEIIDRQEGQYSSRISAKDRVKFSIQKGNAVRNCLTRLIRNIQLENPSFEEFKFQCFRATFGMNFVRGADAAGIKDVRRELKVRMGHKDFNTTQRYLNFDSDNEAVRVAVSYHHERINSVLERFEQ